MKRNDLLPVSENYLLSVMVANKQDTIFHWEGLRIRQWENVFKIGTDAILLGAWAPRQIQHAQHILDVGTGTGILALMLSRKFPDASIKGVDINPDAVKLASQNFSDADQSGRMTVCHRDIFSDKDEETGSFDVIVCNPPYFQSPFFVTDEHRKISRHSEQEYAEWISAFRFYLKEEGHLFIVIPSQSAYNWLQAANEKGFYCATRLDVFGLRSDAHPVRTLLHLHDRLVKPEIKRFCMYERAGEYSKEYLELVNINQASSTGASCL